MKKYFLIIIVACVMSVHALCQNQKPILGSLIAWEVQYEKPVNGGNPFPKSPILPPTVSIDDHTLYIYDVAYAFTLYLLDEDGEVAYTTSVAAGTPTVTLPSDLTGDYELLLVPGGRYYFSGWIEL